MSSTPNDSLWNFVLALYGSKGVSEACLLLQDESGVDVPMLLFALWLASNSVELTAEEILRIDELVRDWREEIVWPLRTVRRRLKEGPHPAPTEETDAMRNTIKAAELNSEKIELSLLEEAGRALLSSATRRPGDARNNALTAIMHYRQADPDARGVKAVETILAAFSRL